MALEKSINDITENDLNSLISNSVSECKELDYKKELIGETNEDFVEILFQFLRNNSSMKIPLRF